MQDLPKQKLSARLMRRRYAAVAAIATALAGGVIWAQSTNTASFQMYPLRYKAATDVQKILSELLVEFGSDAKIVADTRKNQILLSGPEAAQHIAQQLIDSIDQPPAKPIISKPVLRAYQCAERQLQIRAESLRKEFANQDNIRIAVDPHTSQLLILAPEDVHVQLIRQFGAQSGNTQPAQQPQTNTTRSERFVPLRNRTPQRVESLLRGLFDSRLEFVTDSQTGTANYVYLDRSGQQMRIRINQRHNSVVLTGSESLQDQFARLIQTLDGPKSASGERVRVVPIRRSDPVKLRQAIEAYRNGYRAPKTSNNSRYPNRKHFQPQTPLQPTQPLDDDQGQFTSDGPIQQAGHFVQAEAGSNSDVVEDIPAADPQTQQGEPLPGDQLRELGPDVEIETLDDLDVIILRGRDRDVEEITRIIEEIERLSAETEPVIDIYMLKHVRGESVAELATAISEDFVGGRQGRVSVTPLITPNALLLIGWGEAVKAMKDLIEKLDQPVEAKTQLRVFRLQHAPAGSARTTLEQFFANREGLGPKVQVTADVRTNSLVVEAAPRDMQEVALLIGKLDTPGSDAVTQTRIFQLKNSLATDLSTVLQAALTAASGQGGAASQKSSILELLIVDAGGEKILRSGVLNDVQITPDPQRNALLVTAPADSMELLEGLIRHLDELPAAEAQIKVFRIVNGDAVDLVQMLRSMLPAQTGASVGPQLPGAQGETSLVPLRFSVDTRTNSIVATGSKGDLRIIEALLLRLDEKEVQQRKNTVYRLKNAPAIDVAQAVNEFLRSERQVLQAGPGSASPFQQIESEVIVVPEPVSNSLILSATPRYYDEIVKIVEELDAAPPQVMIQILIVEVQLNATDEFGVELGIQDSVLFDRSLLGDLLTTTNSAQQSTAQGIVTATQQIIQAASNTPGFNFNNLPLGNSASDTALMTSNDLGGQALSSFTVGRMNTELGFGGLVLSASNESISVLIRALQESRRLDILSRPQIMTLDNQPAYIQVGQRVPRIVGTTINERGQVNNISLENVGLILGVTPRISPDGLVVMEIDAEKSELGPEQEGIPVSISAAGVVIRSPRVNLTQAQTTVSAFSGETVVLGGLIVNNDSTITRRVPWLSDVPIIGHLFRFDSVTSRRTELLFFLTPHVIRTPMDAERIKQVEAARLHLCAADVHEIHGDIGLYSFDGCPACDAPVPVIYPDVNPRGYFPEEMPGPMPNQTYPPMPGEMYRPLPENSRPMGDSATRGVMPGGSILEFGHSPLSVDFSRRGIRQHTVGHLPLGAQQAASVSPTRIQLVQREMGDAGNHTRLAIPENRNQVDRPVRLPFVSESPPSTEAGPQPNTTDSIEPTFQSVPNNRPMQLPYIDLDDEIPIRRKQEDDEWWQR